MAYIVWIERDHALVYNLEAPGKEPVAKAHVHRVDHHTHALGGLDQARLSKKMFDEIAGRISEAKRILIAGPGVAKFNFNTHLSEHFPKLYRRVEACVTLDHPSGPQICALGRDYLKAQSG
jgi:stalled ribosome rescue protein Dom34